MMWRTGHSLIKEKMREERAVLGGEMSGHIFFADRYFGYDDASMLRAAQLNSYPRPDKKLSHLLSDIQKHFIILKYESIV